MIGNQNRMEEVEAGRKGEHSYYKQKGATFHGAEETAVWQSGRDCSAVEEQVRVWKIAKRLL